MEQSMPTPPAPAAPAAGPPAEVLNAALARARRREVLSRLLAIGSFDLLAALSLYAGYLLLASGFAFEAWPRAGLGAALGAALLATAIRAAFTLRLSLFGAAVLADERIRLKERLSSAVYLDRHPDPERGAWTELVRRDGAQALAGVDIRKHFPVRIPRLLLWTLIPAALAAVFALLPPLDILGLGEGREADAALSRAVAQKREELKKAIEDLKRDADKPPDPEIEKLLEALNRRIAEENQPKKEPQALPPPGEEAKRNALVELARLEDALERQLQKPDLAQLKEFLDRFPPGSKARSPLTAALRDALKEGKFGKALAEMKGLEDQLAALAKKEKDGKLSPEELHKMKQLSEELSRLARDSSMLSKLSKGLQGASGSLSAGDLSQALKGLQGLESDLKSLEELMRDLQFLESSLELAQLSLEELADLHKCPNCGKLSQNPGGT